MLLFPDNFITVCFYYMIINIHQGHDAFVPSDDAGVALTKKVNTCSLSIDRPIHENNNI